jgi:hypothetical protein
MPIAVNDHRAILCVAQYDWPKDTLENPNADPNRQLESDNSSDVPATVCVPPVLPPTASWWLR